MILSPEALRLADTSRAQVADAFLDLTQLLGLAGVSRSEVAATVRRQRVL